MKERSESAVAKNSSNLWGLVAAVVGHLVAVAFICALMAMLVLSPQHLQAIIGFHSVVPEVLVESLPAIALHVGLSACVWALVVILYKLWQRPTPQVIRTRALGSRGSVMTETLVVMPLFLMMTFGMAQLAINNVAGILANVAVYQAARAAWIWQPEVDVQRVDKTVTAEQVANRARIAAALVMTPVAPGEYITTSSGNQAFKDTRLSMGAAQVPAAIILGLDDLVSVAAIPKLTVATRNNLSLTNALDKSSFLRRSMLKFTHAYQATSVTVNADGSNRVGVNLTFQLQEAMPIANRIFGDFKTVEGRTGYYSEFTRTYSFRKQPYTPNAALPNGTFSGTAANSDEGGFDDVDWESQPPPED